MVMIWMNIKCCWPAPTVAQFLSNVSMSKMSTPPRNKWTPPSLSELTPIILNMELTHLGLEASKSIAQELCANIVGAFGQLVQK